MASESKSGQVFDERGDGSALLRRAIEYARPVMGSFDASHD